MKQYVPIIGMEVHVELKTDSKMFCSCPNNPNIETPNKNICEVCLAHPGTLPVPNKKAIQWTVMVGKALNCNILDFSKFDRKHYFYPDLPKGYQISQYEEPIAEHGFIELDFGSENSIRETAKISITRAHLEEDTAKLNHGEDGSTLVDFNRAGVPLVEIVTDPDFKSAIEAKIYCQELRNIVRYLGVSDADMEKGQMRCEANISVQEVGSFEIVDGVVKPLNGIKLNNKVELKNLNSFKAVERGIDYEIKRQTAMIKNAEPWVQQTRGWDDDKQETVMQRTKENAADYRYFPDPDIPPFHPIQIAGKISLPELPVQKRKRFHEEYFLSYSDSKLLSDDKDLANFTENVMSELREWLDTMPESADKAEDVPQKISRLAGGWLTSKLLGILKEKNMEITDVKFSAENFAELIALIYNNKVNGTNALKILLIMSGLDVDKDPTHIMEEKGWGQVSDSGQIDTLVEDVIKNYPNQVEQYKSGKVAIIQFLIGMVMKASEGSADPKIVEDILKGKLV